jgi:hypothetical protein
VPLLSLSLAVNRSCRAASNPTRFDVASQALFLPWAPWSKNNMMTWEHSRRKTRKGSVIYFRWRRPKWRKTAGEVISVITRYDFTRCYKYKIPHGMTTHCSISMHKMRKGVLK